MGKKFKHQKKKKQNQAQNEIQKKVKTEENYTMNFTKRNIFFEEFYRITLKDDLKDDFEEFKKILQEKLPVTFRINSTAPNYQNFIKLLKDKKLIDEYNQDLKISEQKRKKETTPEEQQLFDSLNFQKINWYPNELAWQLNVDKQMFKKSKVFDHFHKFIQKSADSGLITRQEIVSMIPPLLLDVQPQDSVLDMCAAPGSKTSQMMEIQGSTCTGGVVANDADLQRAEMLIHQVQRINSQGILVLNHSGQFLPTLEQNGQKFMFDKILADVPCTGDGAIRKIPQKWEKWHTNDGLGIHQLQVQILLRAIAMTKVGGSILYSTCSINPIEDEAVITEVLRKCNHESLQLIDIHKKLPQLKGRRGLTKWPVLQLLPDIYQNNSKTGELPKDGSFTEYNSYQEYLEKRHIYQKHIINQSMFPEDYKTMHDVFKIQNTMRVLPQDQDTGGFYLALIKKIAPTQLKQNNQEQTIIQKPETGNIQDQIIYEKTMLSEKREQKQKNTLEEIMDIDKKKKPSQKSIFKIIEQEDFDKIKKFYGLTDKCKREQLIMNTEGDKKILIVSETIAKYLECDSKKQLKLVNMGARAFTKYNQSFGNQDLGCPYRICQDAVLVMLQFITKRKVQVSYDQFVNLLSQEKFMYEQIDEELKQKITNIGVGSLIFYVDEIHNDYHIKDAIVVNNYQNSFALMISKELIESFKLRYHKL